MLLSHRFLFVSFFASYAFCSKSLLEIYITSLVDFKLILILTRIKRESDIFVPSKVLDMIKIFCLVLNEGFKCFLIFA